MDEMDQPALRARKPPADSGTVEVAQLKWRRPPGLRRPAHAANKFRRAFDHHGFPGTDARDEHCFCTTAVTQRYRAALDQTIADDQHVIPAVSTAYSRLRQQNTREASILASISCTRCTRTSVTSSVMRDAQRGMWIEGRHFGSSVYPAAVAEPPSAR